MKKLLIAFALILTSTTATAYTSEENADCYAQIDQRMLWVGQAGKTGKHGDTVHYAGGNGSMEHLDLIKANACDILMHPSNVMEAAIKGKAYTVPEGTMYAKKIVSGASIYTCTVDMCMWKDAYMELRGMGLLTDKDYPPAR